VKRLRKVTTKRIRAVQRARLELGKNELCALMIILCRALARRAPRSLRDARPVLTAALLRACRCSRVPRRAVARLELDMRSLRALVRVIDRVRLVEVCRCDLARARAALLRSAQRARGRGPVAVL